MKAYLFAVAVLIAFAGCLPVSQHPLSPVENASADSRLTGVWYGKSGKDSVFLHFVAGKGATMEVVEVDHEQKGTAHTNIYTMFPSAIDGVRYMNIREKSDSEKPYYLARYQIAKSGALTIWMMSESAAAKAIKSDKIAGKVASKGSGESLKNQDITITASTERLAAFVRNSDPELLFSEKFGTFNKLTLPSMETAAESKSAPTKSTSGESAPRKKKPSKE